MNDFEAQSKSFTVSYEFEKNLSVHEVFVNNKYVICPSCRVITLIRFKIIRIISLRDTKDIIDLTRLRKYILRRSFLYDILTNILESSANWTRERTLRKSSFSKNQLQNSIWELYNIGLIKIKCTLKDNSWITKRIFSHDNEIEVDKDVLNQNAFIYSITSTDLSKILFKERTVDSSIDSVLIKKEIKNIISNFLLIEIETPIDDRSKLIRSKLEDIVILANDLSNKEFFGYFGLAKPSSILLEVVKFMIGMDNLIIKGNIMFTQELVESVKILPENRPKYRMLAKQILNFPLIVFNTFRNRIFGDSNIIISSEIYQLIIFLEENLRELIVKFLSQKEWDSSYHLWRILPESIKMGSASQRTFSKKKMPKKEDKQKPLLNKKFDDPLECLRAILNNSYFSDLGKIVSSDSLHKEFFYNIFTELKSLIRAFKDLNLLRNRIMHSHIPSEDIISLGLLGAFIILTGLYNSDRNLILNPI